MKQPFPMLMVRTEGFPLLMYKWTVGGCASAFTRGQRRARAYQKLLFDIFSSTRIVMCCR